VPRGVKAPLYLGLPKRLARMRLASGKTAQALSQLAGAALSTWLRIETQRRLPTIDTIERLAQALGVSPCWLAFGAQGEDPFRQRRPRPPLLPDEPVPCPGKGAVIDLHVGFSKRLRERRGELGLSLRELGQRAGVSAQAIVHAEADRSVPKVDTLEALAFALGVSPCWLAYGQGNPPAGYRVSSGPGGNRRAARYPRSPSSEV